MDEQGHGGQNDKRFDTQNNLLPMTVTGPLFEGVINVALLEHRSKLVNRFFDSSVSLRNNTGFLRIRKSED